MKNKCKNHQILIREEVEWKVDLSTNLIAVADSYYDYSTPLYCLVCDEEVEDNEDLIREKMLNVIKKQAQ